MGVGKESRNMDVKKANLYPKIFCLFWWGEWDLIDPLSGFIAFWGLGRKISCLWEFWGNLLHDRK